MANPTAQEIFNAAIHRSGMNDSNLVSSTEVLSYISTKQREVFLDAAKWDPEFFGKDAVTATRTVYTDSWDLTATPGDLAGVTEAVVETVVGTVTGVSAGTKVNLVTRRWPELDVAPRAYLRGRKITGYGTELGTNNSNLVSVLRIYYPELPGAVATLGTTLSLPGEWSNLLTLPLAKLFAIRDQRSEDVPLLDEEYKSVQAAFHEAVLGYGHGTRRPLSLVPALPLQTQQGA